MLTPLDRQVPNTIVCRCRKSHGIKSHSNSNREHLLRFQLKIPCWDEPLPLRAAFDSMGVGSSYQSLRYATHLLSFARRQTSEACKNLSRGYICCSWQTYIQSDLREVRRTQHSTSLLYITFSFLINQNALKCAASKVEMPPN